MNYDEFTEKLKQQIQESLSRKISFTESVINKTNELLETLIIRSENQMVAPMIYPQKLYSDYQGGVSFSKIADFVCASLMMETPEVPEITPEKAEKCISFSLLNREKNQQLLKNCPFKEVHDMVAVPRWHVSDSASFIVNNGIMQRLKMTKEEILNIAARNTELGNYFCKSMDEILKDMMVEDGLPQEFADDMFPIGQTPFYVIGNQNKFDGSCAVLSDSFMQKTAKKLGAEELYLLPSSRHEMLVVIADSVNDSSELKSMVMDVNSNPDVMKAEDFLSNSIYKYNSHTHSLSVCDSKGIFHDKEIQKDITKQSISRGRD